jgi:hypothetical protein
MKKILNRQGAKAPREAEYFDQKLGVLGVLAVWNRIYFI